MRKKSPMSSATLKKQPITKAQAELISHMTEEVHLMREILANMHEEQQALLNVRKDELVVIMQRRNGLFCQLVEARYRRFMAMQSLTRLLSGGDTERLFSEEEGLEALLASDSDDACEILSLRDQMVALIEKMNAQNRSNQDLAKHPVQPSKNYVEQRQAKKKAAKTVKRVLLEDEA